MTQSPVSKNLPLQSAFIIPQSSTTSVVNAGVGYQPTNPTCFKCRLPVGATGVECASGKWWCGTNQATCFEENHETETYNLGGLREYYEAYHSPCLHS